MNVHAPIRGSHLAAAGQRGRSGTGLFARLVAGGFERVLDRIDRGLDAGSLLVILPDGTQRLFGARAEGPEAEIELRHWNALLRLATGGSAGWYQAWEAGEWDSPDPVQLFALFMRNAATLGGVARAKGPWRWLLRRLHLLQPNTIEGSQKNIAAHYDLGNDFYQAWLGATMIYSSGLFDAADDGESGGGPSHLSQFFAPIDRGQSNKCGEIVRRLDGLQSSRLLEIGCGWGTLAAHLADHFAAPVDAISLSDEQLAFAREKLGTAAAKVDFRRQDYRDVAGQYDAIVSIEMVEAVGREYWPSFFDCLDRCLAPGGRAVIQFISIRDELFDAYAASADFIQTYIFPGGMLIRESEFRRLAADRRLTWSDQLDFGLDYAETLALWREAFDAAVEVGDLPAGFDAHFVRLWRYYLMYCEGGFRGGGIDVSLVTLTRS